MKLEEFESLRNQSRQPLMIGPMGEETKTLLYGYDHARRTYHVFQHEGEIHRVIYTPDFSDGSPVIHDHQHGSTLPIEELIPDKRVYPALSDFSFCLVLVGKRITIPFTGFDPDTTLESRGGMAGKTGIEEIDNSSSGPKPR